MLYAKRMRDLAIIVTILVLIPILAGPLSLAISFIKPRKYFSDKTKKIVISVLALSSCAVAALLFFNSSTNGARFIGIFGMSLGSLALYRTYRPKPIE